MKKILLLVPLLVAGIALEMIAAKFTVKFDPSFINAANGKEATYKFTPKLGWGVDFLITLNQDNKEGNHISKVNATRKVKQQFIVPQEEAALHKIDNLNGGFIFGLSSDCLVELKVEAETGPLAKQIAQSTKSIRQCHDQVFIIKVEDGKLKIDREKKAEAKNI